VLRSVLAAEADEAQREAGPPPLAAPEASLNGHLAGDAAAMSANGNGRVGDGLSHPEVAFGTKVQMTERRVGLRGETEK
jgi:hypothetical protein